MKTTIKNIIVAGITATVLLGTTLAAKADVAPTKSTVLSAIKNINNIAISGNVELILIQGTAESVEQYTPHAKSLNETGFMDTPVKDDQAVLEFIEFAINRK